MPLKGYTLVESRAKLHNHDPRRVFRVEWLSSRGPSTLLIRSERNDLEFQYVVGSRIGETSQGALATRRFFPLFTALIPAMLLLILPPLLWASSIPGNPANVGGDIPNTLFLDPGSFLTHLMSQKIGIGLTGTDTFLPYFSLAVVAFMLNSVGLDSQLVVAGLVLALTYLGVYFLIMSILPRRALWTSRVSAAVGGSVAVLRHSLSPTLETGKHAFIFFRSYHGSCT